MLEIHPVAKMWPAMSDADFKALVDDMRENGQQVPIQLFDGQIIDGAHRYKACELLGFEPKTEDWDGTDETLTAHVVSLNEKRRHLTASQRAMIAEKIASRVEGRPRPKVTVPAGTVTRKDAAKLLNVGEGSVGRARTVVDHGIPELAEAVEKGEVAVKRAESITHLPKEEQKAAMEQPTTRETRKEKNRHAGLVAAVNKIEIAAECLGRATVNGNGRAREWAETLRTARTHITRFVRQCEKDGSQ